MKLKGVIFEDFVNYKKPCMTLEFPYCNFKCGNDLCQNSSLVNVPTKEVDIDSLIDAYCGNLITSAVCFQGLEPFDSFNDLLSFIVKFREKSNDDIVIYTGYNEEEIKDKLTFLKKYDKIIIKFGRYLINKKNKFEPLLGITLTSDNQYAKRIEDI